jgi:hypothetical protein
MTRQKRRRGGDSVVTIFSFTDVNTFIAIVESLENQKPVMSIVSAGSPMLMGQMQGAVSVNGRGACNRNNISSIINSDHAGYSAPGTAWHSAVD